MKKLKNISEKILILLRLYWPELLVCIGVIVYAIILSHYSMLRHQAFDSSYDLAHMDQTVWNTYQGRFFTLTGDEGTTVSRLSIHADFILAMVAPVYAIWESPMMLEIIESIWIALGAIPTFLIANHVLKKKSISLLIAFIYLLNAPLHWANIYDFHAVTLAIPTLLAAFYYVLKKNWKWFALFTFIALLTKENISIHVALFGLMIAFVFKEKKIGLITFATGCLWFLVMVFGIMPYFSPKGTHWVWEWYKDGGESNGGIINKLVGMIQKFFAPEIIAYYIQMFRSFGFLPILGLPWLVLAGPEFAINVLSIHDEMHSIKYHYVSGLIPGIMIASIYGIYYVTLLGKKIKNIKKFQTFIPYVLTFLGFFIALRFSYYWTPLPIAPACWCVTYEVTNEDKEFEKILQSLPETASVTASNEIQPHITHREVAYVFPVATDSADFIALTDQYGVFDNSGPKPKEIAAMEALNKEGKYELVEKIGHFYLYKRKGY